MRAPAERLRTRPSRARTRAHHVWSGWRVSEGLGDRCGRCAWWRARGHAPRRRELREQKVLIFDGLIKVTLAEAEARAGHPDRAIAILEEALATSDRTGYRAFEAELHRARGEILLKRDPANPAPAEEAFLTAIAVAKQQATRSFELRAALSVAKLFRSTGRPADAHAVLAPALEGFAPTPEMPEIAEAHALLATLGAARRTRPRRTTRRAAAGKKNRAPAPRRSARLRALRQAGRAVRPAIACKVGGITWAPPCASRSPHRRQFASRVAADP